MFSFAGAAELEIVFIAPSNHAMPWAQFKDEKLSAGLLKDLGELIASRLARKAKFIIVPSNRVRGVLLGGSADALCYVRPEWIDGNYNWTPALIQDGAVVAARIGAPVIHTLADLHNVPVGTVIGYRYPEIETALGQGFVREDAPSMESNMRKLIAGRMEYAILEKMVLDYHLRKDQSIQLRVDLLYISFDAQCAFSLSSKIPFADVTRVIKKINEDGSADEIFSRYR
ncbi:MAG: transporter substrate-binding domain-containing protein [Pseudomonadota bacterium]